MKDSSRLLLDGNEAAVSVAYRLSETIAIYPITPSSGMAEMADEWSAQERPNLFGSVPRVVEMQSEGGAAGAVHGMLQGGALTTTFTASQGLLLMIPNMYKIAGELLPFCMHVTARALATHALSIFGDHSDVMACRQTGFGMLVSNSPQEAQDCAAIAHLATLQTRVPMMHFFDGFRTSHEINTLTELSDDELNRLVDPLEIARFRRRALSPEHPTVRGTAQNPDVFFQAREAANPFYLTAPAVIREEMRRFAELTGRKYDLFEYVGDPQAERVVVAMGSANETLAGVVAALNRAGERVGLLKVRLFRPWSWRDFVETLPSTVRSIAVLDRTKEPGSMGEPLFQDVVTSLEEARETGAWDGRDDWKIVSGRYGLGSKEFNPAMAKAVFDELKRTQPRRRFTVGIRDDVTGLSLDYDPKFNLRKNGAVEAIFFGLGSDGTVGANKNTVKIIGEETPLHAQAYFVYDSKKSGSMTTSHLRFGPDPISAPYLIEEASFVGCHQFSFLEKYDVVGKVAQGGTLLLNAPFAAEDVWSHLPAAVQQVVREKELKLYAIDAYTVAREAGLGGRINTIMQTCFFKLSGVLPEEEAIARIKEATKKAYAKKGDAVVQKNFAGIDAALANLHAIEVPDAVIHLLESALPESDEPDFIQRVTRVMLRNEGDRLPVSAFPVGGVWPTGTARYEKRNIAQSIPTWDAETCIQCNKCSLVCPHAAIRAKFFPEGCAEDAPEGFTTTEFRSRAYPQHEFTIQVSAADCTGCNLCVEVCPAKSKEFPDLKALVMQPTIDVGDQAQKGFDYFLNLPEPDPRELGITVKDSQFRTPLFEFSGACSGCGETPYIKLLTQLFGDRLLIANATGCSSIFGGNLPTTPYTVNKDGRGPAWANSLFEDNAEFGLGMRLAHEHRRDTARRLLGELGPKIYDGLVKEILDSDQSSDLGVSAQRQRIDVLREWLRQIDQPIARELEDLAEDLVDKSVWIVGGDGWAYDIGFGGLDHVLASGANVNILVLDTGTYSNTGGQQSKATPMGAVAKFAAAGKATPKKDLAVQAMLYGHVYVAQVAIGAKDSQTVQALAEAAAYPGPSLILAYAHCISHGFSMNHGLDHQKAAVDTGMHPLYRFDPRRREEGQVPLKLDSKAPSMPLIDLVSKEGRFDLLRRRDPAQAASLCAASQDQLNAQYERLKRWSQDG